MSKVLDIADRKIEAGRKRLLEDFETQYQTMLRNHSANGGLRSGNTVRETMNIAIESGDLLRNLIIDQSTWAIRDSIYVPMSFSEELNVVASKHFSEFKAASEEYVKKASEMSGNPAVHEKVYPEVENKIQRSLDDCKLEIEALVASNHSRGIKGIGKFIFSCFAKFWGR